MPASHAAITAVLRTLVRASVDARVPIVLRSRNGRQARELALWLSAVHGSQRTVLIAEAPTSGAQIEIRLPARMAWPAPSAHLSAMTQHSLSAGAR